MKNSEYSQLLKKLLEVNLHSGVKLGLKNSLTLDALLDYPSQSFPSIHVAGTNGKGSVVTKIAASLIASGLKVGVYTSPHLSCFRERIQINGVMISEKAIISHLSLIFDLLEKNHLPATFFEITTLMAFHYFSAEKIDVAVVETGLGGRLDATNIVKSRLSIITSISFDHTEILGNSLKEISLEKAGIIKPFIPVVIGPTVPFSLIQSICEEKQSSLYQVNGTFSHFYAENKAIANQALKLLNLPEEYRLEGLKQNPPCRFEIFLPEDLPLELQFNKMPKAVILDVAHNPDGIRHLLAVLIDHYPTTHFRIVLGLSANKDIKACLTLLLDKAFHFHLVQADNDRAATPSFLEENLLQLGLDKSKITCEPSIHKGLHSAIFKAGEDNEVVIVCGTFFIMSEARIVLGISEPQDNHNLNEHFKKC